MLRNTEQLSVLDFNPLDSKEMELHQLKTFVTVAKTGNVTRAARELNTTPPSVSSHIKILELEFDVTLFTRTSKGMEITAQGKRLKEKAIKILEDTNDFYNTAAVIQHKIIGQLRLGINADPGYLKVPLIIKEIFKKHAQLNLEIVPSNTGEILTALENKEMDCGFVFGEHNVNGFEMIRLARADISVAVPILYKKTHENAQWADIAKLPWIVPTNLCPFVRKVEDLLSEENLALTNTIFANDDITKNTLIHEGAAVTAIEKNEAKRLAKNKIIFIWETPEKLSCPISIAYSKNRAGDVLIKTLVKIIKNTWHHKL